MNVAKITQQLAEEIAGTQAPGAPTLFNPVKDANSNWIISLETAAYLDEEQYEVIEWVGPWSDGTEEI